MKSCSDCVHFRQAKPVDPFAGVRLVSHKALELRAKWQQELATRAQFEEQRFAGGLAFDFEPFAYAYCDLFSQQTRAEAVTGDQKKIYELCARKNPKGDCDKHLVR